MIESHFDEGKHLYWRAMNKAGRKAAMTLGLLSLPYPKPARTIERQIEAGSAQPRPGDNAHTR
jgi:hypothetical protein